MPSIPFLDLGSMHQEILDDALASIEAVIRRNAFVLGDEVSQFEKAFAAYCGVDYAIGVDTGLSALELALRAYDLQPGDEVIIPANTFIATAAAAVFINLTPRFVDVAPGTYDFDYAQLEGVLTPRTRAIIPVHLYGTPARMDKVKAFAQAHHLMVLEDASQAHGAYFQGKRVGSLGDIAAFSLYPGKNLGAFGEAGIITTNNAEVADKIRAMRNCGQTEKYVHSYHPYNRRLDTIQAAILTHKLAKLDTWNAMRRQAAAWYTEVLQGTHLTLPCIANDVEPVWHLYVVQTPHRDELKQYLQTKGVATGIHYPIPIHLSPVYKWMGYKEGDYPVTEQECKQLLSLPMFPHIARDQVAFVAESIRAFEREKGISA